MKRRFFAGNTSGKHVPGKVNEAIDETETKTVGTQVK